MAFPPHNPVHDRGRNCFAMENENRIALTKAQVAAMRVQDRVNAARREALMRNHKPGAPPPIAMPYPKVHYTLHINSGGFWGLLQLGFDPNPPPEPAYRDSGDAIRAKSKTVGGLWYKDGPHTRYVPTPDTTARHGLALRTDKPPAIVYYDMTSGELERRMDQRWSLSPDGPLERGDY